jgi:ATP adenylyltransferase
MDRLWTPWRYSYISRLKPAARIGIPEALAAWPGDYHCVFCNMIASVDHTVAHGLALDQAEKAAWILHRGEHCFLCLNAFPYTTGHVLIVPYQHLAGLAELPTAAAQEMMHYAQTSETILRQTYNPDGLNLGLNLGEAAGAGIAAHLHMHALPRWVGDTNFMTVIGETRVLPEAPETTWSKLRARLSAL